MKFGKFKKIIKSVAMFQWSDVFLVFSSSSESIIFIHRLTSSSSSTSGGVRCLNYSGFDILGWIIDVY